MAEQYSLDAQPRTVFGKQVKALRRQDIIPAVIYGAGGEPVHVSCVRRPLEVVLLKAGGTHLINVSLEGETHTALVREVQRDVVKRTVLHVDFLRVDLSRKLHAEVPLVLHGDPKLPSDLQLIHSLNSIEVECLPTDIPDHVEVDLSNLTGLGSQITVGELSLGDNIAIITDPHTIIARVEALQVAPVEEEAAAVVEGAVTSEPEVVEKGKKEEEEF